MSELGRAAVFVGPRKPFDLRDMPLPDPEPGAVLVAITATNVCGSDLHLWRGDNDLQAAGATYPMILGHEMVGRVARLGRGVRQDASGQALAEGDRVVYTYFIPCGTCRACLRGAAHACLMSLASVLRPCEAPPHFVGGFASHYLVGPSQKIFRLPAEVADRDVAGANCGLAQILFGLAKVGLSVGESVVVQGAGGLGLYACAVAREMGASPIIALDGVPARLELARRFGADEVIDVSSTDARARVHKVRALTGGWGADVVVEVVGFPEVVPEGLRMLGRGGRYLELGNISPKRTYTADPSLLVLGNLSMHGVCLYEPLALRRAVDFIARSGSRYPFAEIFSHSFPLERIDEAFAEADAFASARRTAVRVSVTPSSR
jgi:D-arabinose 1-dehydrogenase-like Zn-dependent alcohol dehydrogenase